MKLQNAIIVITGGSQGLGKALAEVLVKAGARVIITARRNKLLQQTAKEISATPIALDVREEKQVRRLGQAVVKRFGRLDIWINNAGVWLPHTPIEKMDMAKLHDMMEINLFGTIYGSKFALEQMRRQGGGGIIVNILSTSALAGRAGSSGYCASKYAVDGFSKSLRLEVEGDGIKVISVYPGGMRTNLFDQLRPADYDNYMDPNEVAKKIIENVQSENPELEQILRRPVYIR